MTNDLLTVAPVSRLLPQWPQTTKHLTAIQPEDQRILKWMNGVQFLYVMRVVWDRERSGEFFATRYKDQDLATAIRLAVVGHETKSNMPSKPQEVYIVEDYEPAFDAFKSRNDMDREQLRRYRSKLKAALPAAWKKGEPLKEMSKKTALQEQLQEPPSLQAIHPNPANLVQDVEKDHQPNDPSPASGATNHPTKPSTSVPMRPEHLLQLAKAAADEKKRVSNEKRLATRKKNKIEREEKTRKVEFLL